MLQQEKKHKNSHEITIKRAGSFLERAQSKDISDYYADSKTSIGSYWEGAESNVVGSGLTNAERRIIMPRIIAVDAEDRGFLEACNNYFHEMDTKVPYVGVRLEIGLEIDNDKAVSKDNMPLNPSHFVKWRHALGHPYVGMNEKEAMSNPLKQFYVFDPLESKNKEKKNRDEQDAAMQIYLKVKMEPEKVKQMVVLMGADPREFTPDTMVDFLKEKAQKEPEKFVQAYSGEDLEVKYWLLNMAKLGVLLRVGDKFIDIVTKKTIGQNMEESIAYFLDPENSNNIVVLKARMQDAGSKPVIVDTKFTKLTAKQAADKV